MQYLGYDMKYGLSQMWWQVQACVMIKSLNFIFFMIFFSFFCSFRTFLTLRSRSLSRSRSRQTVALQQTHPPCAGARIFLVFFIFLVSRTIEDFALPSQATLSRQSSRFTLACARADHQCTAWSAAKSIIPRKDPLRPAWIRGARERTVGHAPGTLSSSSFAVHC